MIYLGNSVDDAQRPPEPEMSSDTSRDVLSRGLEMESREVFVLELQTNHRIGKVFTITEEAVYFYLKIGVPHVYSPCLFA